MEETKDLFGVNEQTPRQIVAELDRYIVGQNEAKRSVAIALRNRWRSRQLQGPMRDEVVPKNILMIGSTGVGKTEIARRLAKLVKAPFVKVEATKFTEVGYVGRDVETIVRDLAEVAVRMVRQQRMEAVREKAEQLAEERILDVFVPQPKKTQNPLGRLFGGTDDSEEKDENQDGEPKKYQAGREWVKKRLDKGELEKELIEVEVEESARPMIGMLSGSVENMSDDLQDMIGSMVPKRRKKRKVTVAEARKIFIQQESEKLIDMDAVAEEARNVAERSGIVFLDEIDKVAVHDGASGGADVSREGVQRDILPIVEGTTVMTKYGPVKTDYVLFIAAGAFHLAKPSDLIPELQGRFPIRVELQSLRKEDFEKILTEPQNALIKQYQALLATEGVEIEFRPEAISRIAQLACDVNDQSEDIGARRLHTLREKLIEDTSFQAPELEDKHVVIDEEYVDEKLSDIVVNRDLSQFIL